MKILILDDDFSVLRNLKNTLERQQWEVDLCSQYKDAVEKIQYASYDLIITDYQLSRKPMAKHGMHFVRHVREKGVHTPILFLTAKQSRYVAAWDALDAGVDDFIRKPYKEQELVSRVKALIRRSFALQHNSTNILSLDGISMDLDKRKVFVNGEEVHLGKTPFHILTKFIKEPNRVIPYEDLIRYIWTGSNRFSLVETKNKLRVHMTYLKQKIGNPQSKHISTVHGVGYIWNSKTAPMPEGAVR